VAVGGTAGPPPAGSPPPQTARCPRCDAAFGCGVDTGACWCAGVTLSGERRARLAAGYDGCLCPACLRELERDG
jgi:hypothetical protein